nr:MAG TPA: hypothetical protein [Caudoviricetes sp.]
MSASVPSHQHREKTQEDGNIYCRHRKHKHMPEGED